MPATNADKALHTPIGTTAEIASLVGGELRGAGELVIDRLDAVHAAGPDALTFIRDERFVKKWVEGRAGAALVSRELQVPPFDDSARAIIVVDDADQAMITLLERIAAVQADNPEPGVHETAVIDDSAEVDPTATVGPRCVVGAGARVGPRTVLHSGVTLGAGVEVGSGCTLHPHVVLQPGTTVGRECTLHPGVVIGADGFGYRPAPDGNGIVKIPHIGGVRIGDGVEIGANTAIDRGKFGDTTIGDGTKIDNLVQIGHNCTVGRFVIICGACAIGGSTTIGDGATLAGACMIADNVTIAPGAKLGGAAQVPGDIDADGEWWIGAPARPASETKRSLAALATLPKTRQRIRELEQRLRALEAERGQA